MKDGFTRRREQSKEEIRKAAWELFSHFGVEKVSIVDIAHKAGVSQATIYNNFGGKEALVREFVAAVIDQLVSRASEVLTPGIPFWDKMAAMIQFISENMAQARPSEGDDAVLNGSLELLNDPEIKKIRTAAYEKMIKILLGLVQEGKDQGEIPETLSDEACRMYFRAFMDLFTDLQHQYKFQQDHALARDLGRLMIFGLTGQR